MAQPLIEIRDLTRRASDRLLLDKVNFTIDAGQRIGLVGPSGSGKSMLLRAIAMLDPCESGQVKLRGQVVAGDDVPAYRREVVYLSQRPAFMRGTARENLQLPFGFRTTQAAYDELRIANWLAQLTETPSIIDQPVDSLSGGEQQIIAFVRALAVSPQVLLLDEPTASLDAEVISRFEELVDQWSSDDTAGPRSLVWTSHDAQQIERVATEIVQIENGRVDLETAS